MTVKVLDWVYPPIFPGSYTRQIYWWIMKQEFKSDTRFEETQQHLTSNSTPRQKYEYIAIFERVDSNYGWGA